MKTIFDTSALISLEHGGVLDKCLQILEIIITPTIVEELNEISKYKDINASAAKRVLKLIKKGEIKVVTVKNSKTARELLSRDVDFGEAECFAACLENKVLIFITDDVDAAYGLSSKAKLNSISIKISAAVIIELLRQSIISKHEAKNSLQQIIKTRRWEGGVLEVLMKKYLNSAG